MKVSNLDGAWQCHSSFFTCNDMLQTQMAFPSTSLGLCISFLVSRMSQLGIFLKGQGNNVPLVVMNYIMRATEEER